MSIVVIDSQPSRGKNLVLPDLSVEQNTLQSGTTFSASIVVCHFPGQACEGRS